MSAADARDAYEAAFLAEVARLLPDVDVVRLRRAETPPVASGAVTRRSLADAAGTAARRLVEGWAAAFGAEHHPSSLRFEWAQLGSQGVVHARATARLRDESVDAPDAAVAARRLRRRGWSTAIRNRSEDGFSVLADHDGFRLDVVVADDARLRAARVTGPPMVAGDDAPRLGDAAPQEVPWPPRR